MNLTPKAWLMGGKQVAPWGIRQQYFFKGIPYAQPPTGERRFQPPQPVKLWQGEKQAVEFGKFIFVSVILFHME